MTTKEIPDFSINNEYIKSVEMLLLWFSYQLKWALQPGKQEKTENQKGSNGKIRHFFNSQDVSLDTKAKVIHTLVFPITMNNWTEKKIDRKKY